MILRSLKHCVWVECATLGLGGYVNEQSAGGWLGATGGPYQMVRNPAGPRLNFHTAANGNTFSGGGLRSPV